MALRKVQFVNDEFYHIFNRGVEGRKIFLDDEDNLRFINSLMVFNDEKPAPWNMCAFWNQRGPSSLVKSGYKPDSPLVEIYSFALMENHFHLLLKQLKDNGVNNFMRKICGYSSYFNKKYQRVGSLFQSRFKAVMVRTDEQLKNAFVYITTNPVSLIEPGWKENGIKDFKKSVKFLREYKWSNYPDYLEKENNYPFIEKDFFLKLFGGANGCSEEVDFWLEHKFEINKFKSILLE